MQPQFDALGSASTFVWCNYCDIDQYMQRTTPAIGYGLDGGASRHVNQLMPNTGVCSRPGHIFHQFYRPSFVATREQQYKIGKRRQLRGDRPNDGTGRSRD